jgi:hypothetical protein
MNLQRFLAWLYEFCEENQVETRALAGRKQAFHSLGDWQAVEKWCQRFKGQNLYVAVATRNGGGTKEHIREIPALWCDIDWKDLSQPEAKRAVWDFPQRASLVVESGGGYHVYWRLKEPGTRQDILRVEMLNRQIASYLKGDMQATDASRILRLPGTLNFKYKPPRQVKVVWQTGLDWNLEDLADALPAAPQLSSEPSQASNYNRKDTTSLSLSERGDSTANPPGIHTSPQESTRVHKFNLTEGHRDATIFHVANSCLKGGMEQANVEALLQFLASKCSPPFPEKEVQEKVKSALKRARSREKSIAREVREWVLESTGVHFQSTEVHRSLQLSTKEEQRAALEELRRLRTEGILEAASDKRGHYRVVQHECTDIDFLNASGEEIDVTWPLAIEGLFRVYPRNIIVVAGDPDAGKTAFLLNLVRLNMDIHQIYYFISEMGSQELRTRLQLFTDVPIDKWRFHPKERASNFQDVILPDGFNIIDFLEIHDNFYQIGGLLKAIHDKLRGGIAVIAIQKARGAQLGRGGSFSLEKPRLYVTLSRDGNGNFATIEKCKNWRTSTNPNAMQRRFKLYQGTKFVPTTEWQRPE